MPIAIHLHGNVIAVQSGISVTRLHGPADTQVERQADAHCGFGHAAGSAVAGAVINDNYIKLGERSMKLATDLGNRFCLVERGNNGKIP